MGNSQSYTIYSRQGSIPAHVSALLLKQLPDYKSARFETYIVGQSEAAVKATSFGKTAVLFLGVIPVDDVLTHVSYYANSVTCVTDRVSQSGEGKTLPKVAYLHYPDQTPLMVVWQQYVQPYLAAAEKKAQEAKAKEAADKKAKEDIEAKAKAEADKKEAARVAALTAEQKAEEEAKKKKDEEAKKKTEEEAKKKKEEEEAKKKAADEEAAKKDKVIASASTAAAAAAGVTAAAAADMKADSKAVVGSGSGPAVAAAAAVDEKKKTPLERLGVVYGAKAPWWLEAIDEYGRGLSRQNFAVLHLLQCALMDNVSEEQYIALLSKSPEELVDQIGSAKRVEQKRIDTAVQSAELKDWFLPSKVAKAMKAKKRVVYADVERGTDLQRIADGCFERFKEAELFAGRLRVLSGQIEFVLRRPKDSDVNLNELSEALNSVANGLESMATVTRPENPIEQATKFLP